MFVFFENIEQFQNIFFSFCNPKKLTKENCELDVRIAVIEHEITQKVLKMATAHWEILSFIFFKSAISIFVLFFRAKSTLFL